MECERRISGKASSVVKQLYRENQVLIFKTIRKGTTFDEFNRIVHTTKFVLYLSLVIVKKNDQ